MYEEKEIKYKKRKKEKTSKTKKEISKKIQSKKETKSNNKNTKEKKKIIKVPQKQVKKKEEKNTSTIFSVLNTINWKQLLLKLLILTIVMMLLIFTISRIRKQHEKQNEAFTNNISIISNATLKYFEENPLPKNIGDSTSFILEEMKNLNLIEEIKNEENKFCNYLDSYIILTKTANEEYRLKIYLKCPDKNKTVEEKITCTENNCFIKK